WEGRHLQIPFLFVLFVLLLRPVSFEWFGLGFALRGQLVSLPISSFAGGLFDGGGGGIFAFARIQLDVCSVLGLLILLGGRSLKKLQNGRELAYERIKARLPKFAKSENLTHYCLP